MSAEEEDVGIANISGDDAFDENELKMKELAEQRKQQPFRPTSSKAPRPESAHHGFKAPEKLDAFKVYAKFSQFVNSQGIMRDAFYPRNTAMLTKDHFANCFQIVSFPITPEEFNAIWADLGGTGTVELSQFYSKLTCWKDVLFEKPRPKQDVVANLNMELLDDLDRKAQRLALNEDFKQSVQLQLKPQSAVGMRKRILPRPFSSSTKKSDPSGRGKFMREKINYLKQAKIQEEKELSELDNMIKLGKKKQEFDCLHKIREACKIAQALNKPYTFTTATKGDAGLEIFIVEDDGTRPCSLEEFMREYKKLKREENSITLKQGRSNMGASKVLPPGMDTPMVSTMTVMKAQNKDSKKEKQKKLLEVLKDTMKLTQILKEQLKILEEKGVYGGERMKK